MIIKCYFDKLETNNGTIAQLNRAFEDKVDPPVFGFTVHDDMRGRYLQFDNPVAGLLKPLADLPFTFVTIEETGVKNSPAEGVYEDEEAIAFVDHYLGNKVVWRIRIKADTYDKALGLFRKIRSAQIQPKEPWIGAEEEVSEPDIPDEDQDES